MKIAYLVNQYPKVSHSFIRREIQAVERLGIDVFRFSLRGWDAELVDPEDIAERDRTRFVLKSGFANIVGAMLRWACTAPGRFTRTVVAAFGFMRGSDRPALYHLFYLAEACIVACWLRKYGIDHIHAHFGTNSTEVALLAGLLSATPYSFTTHGIDETDNPLAINLREKVRRAQFVATVSSYGRSQIFRCIPHTDWDKVHVIHCGIERGFFADKFESPSEPGRLVCVGRLSPEKAQLLLLTAIRRVLDSGRHCSLCLVGDGPMRAELERQVEALGLTAQVEFTGAVDGDDVRRIMLSGRAVLLPSFAEGLPVVLMEAMALYRPVLTTYVGGVPELVIDGKTGWLFPAGDLEALVDAICECLDASESVLYDMGAAGRSCVNLSHSVDSEALKLGALFGYQAPVAHTSKQGARVS